MRISEQTYTRVVSFVRQITNDCTTCMRRCTENCERCRSTWAKSILADIEADAGGGAGEVDYSLEARVERILKTLREYDGPLMSQDIDLGDMCSPQLKMWTLKRLVRRGVVCRKAFSRKGKVFYRYRLSKKESK